MSYLIDNSAYKARFCPICVIYFQRSAQLDQHLFEVHREHFENYQHGSGESEHQITFSVVQTALNQMFIIYDANFDGIIFKDVDGLFLSAREGMTNVLKSEVNARKNLRVIFSIVGVFTKTSPITGEREIASKYEFPTFRSFDHIILRNSMIPRILDTARDKIAVRVEEYTENGSGWVLERIEKLSIKISDYNIISGGTFMELPTLLKRKTRSLLNVRNTEENEDGDHLKCFIWSILAHRSMAGIPPGRKYSNLLKLRGDKVSYYKPHLDKLVLDGLKFPMTVDQIYKFEKLNPTIGITVLGYTIREGDYEPDDCDFEELQTKIRDRCYPIHMCKERRKINIDLLLLIPDIPDLQKADHFVLIKNFKSFLQNRKNHRIHDFCRNCLQCFRQKGTLFEHQKYCYSKKMQKTTFPKEKDKILKFKNWQNTQKLSYIIYADFEAIVPALLGEETQGKSMRTNLHKPCGYSWIAIDHKGDRVCSNRYRASSPKEDVGKRFLEEIIEQCATLKKIMAYYQAIAKTNMVFERPPDPRTTCFFCDEPFPAEDEQDQQILKDRGCVKHHEHLPPFHFKGFAHNTCNLAAKMKTTIPVLIHNLAGYDAHFIVQALNKDIVESVDILARTSERFASILVNKYIRFCDSFAFFPKSLSDLVACLDRNDAESFKIMRQEFGEESYEAMARQMENILPHMRTDDERNAAIFDIISAGCKSYPGRNVDFELLLKKQSYPYAYMTSIERFEDDLPPKSAFFNDLNQEHISDKDYEHLQKVWKHFELKNLGDLHDIYVATDACLLACVFESNRRTMLKNYQLDIAHYFSLAHVSKDAMLKKTKAKIELITDPDQYLFVENSVRGGLVTVGSLRSSVANNQYLKEYDNTKETSFLMFFDFNNLYGSALSEKMPEGDYKWVEGKDLERMRRPEFFMNLDDDAEIAYFVEVDLVIDPEHHDYLDAFPPCPLHRVVEKESLSPYQRNLMEKLDIRESAIKTNRLIADLLDKNNVVVHSRNLKLWVQLGCRITKIHKALSFRQSNWFEIYIRFNTMMRRRAKSDIEIDFFKSLSNISYGKLIERLRNRKNVIAIMDETRGRRYNKKPTMSDFRIINDGLVILMMKKLSVHLYNPVAAGAACLEISKLLMYQFYYKFLKPKFENMSLMYSDTDSFILYIIYENHDGDAYQDIYDNKERFDLSGYNPDDPIWGKFYRGENCRKLGVLKDEMCNAVLTHVIIVRSKVYIVRFLKNKYDKLEKIWRYEPSEKKKVKGIQKSVVQKDITQVAFTNALSGIANPDVTMHSIRSFDHILYSMTLKKKNINAFEIKRYILPNSFRTLAFGNKAIKPP